MTPLSIELNTTEIVNMLFVEISPIKDLIVEVKEDAKEKVLTTPIKTI
jgi:hypothetical protein